MDKQIAFPFFVFLVVLCSCGCIQEETPDWTLLEGAYPGASGDSWCNSDYAKRIDVNVNNTAGSALTDYQVYVDLTSNPINETSLRVYNTTDCTLRPHWTENETGGNSYGVWINYSAVAGSSWTNDTSIYHDNNTASSASNGEKTFLLFDDFNDNSINTTKWDVFGSKIYEQNQRIEITETGGAWSYLRSDNTWTNNYRVVVQKAQSSVSSGGGWRFLCGYAALVGSDIEIGHQTPWYYLFGVYTPYSDFDTTPPTYYINTDYRLEIRQDGGDVEYYIDDILVKTKTGSTENNNNIIIASSNQGKIDGVFLCNYNSSDPCSTLGTEEQPPGTLIISNKQPTSPISKPPQAANFAINATVSEATNNRWEIDRTGSYEHLEWDNSTTSPAYTFSPVTEGEGTYTVKLTAYNATVPTYNLSTTWGVTVANITISLPSPGLTDTKYVSNKTVTYSATTSRTANCSWKYQNGTLIEWDNSTTSPTTELWINSSAITTFNITLTAYAFDCPTDYNSTSWNNFVTDDIFDCTNYTWERWDIFDDETFAGHTSNITVGDIDNDGEDEIIMIDCPLYLTNSKDILIYEKNGTYKIYPAITTNAGPVRDISVHDVDQDGQNELLVLLSKSTGMIAEIFRFSTTGITASNKNKDIGYSGSNNPKAIAWMNISNQEHFYTCGCGQGEVVNVFLNLTSFSVSEIDNYSVSSEDNVAWDIDNDGDDELLVVEGYSGNAAKIWMYEIDKTTGNYDSKTLLFDNDLNSANHYYAVILVGDVDNDGVENLIVFWVHDHPDTPSYNGPIEAYEFDGISEFGEGNYSESFTIVSTGDVKWSSASGHLKYGVGDCDADSKNELIYGTWCQQQGLPPSYIWKFDIGANGSTVTESAIATFSSDYMGGATYNSHAAVPRIYDDNGTAKIFLSVNTEASSGDRYTEIFVMTAIKSVGTPPVISNVVNGSVSSTSQYIDWTVNQTAHNRVIYSNESDLTPAWYSSWDNSTALPNITLSGLTASTQYWYQAWSYNTTNNSLSDNSSTLSFTTAAVDTSFTVTLPSGYTYLRFEPTNATATNVTPNGQTDLQEFYNVTNTGDVNLDVRLQLNETVANIILKADSDSNSVGAKEVNTTLVTIHSNLAIANTADIWLWSDFNYAVQQDTNKTISINVTQSP